MQHQITLRRTCDVVYICRCSGQLFGWQLVNKPGDLTAPYLAITIHFIKSVYDQIKYEQWPFTSGNHNILYFAAIYRPYILWSQMVPYRQI